MKKTIRPILCGITTLLLAGVLLMPNSVEAKESMENVEGTVYEFGSKDHYEFQNATDDKATTCSNSNGTFSIVGDVNLNGKQDGVVAYDTKSDAVSLAYIYDDGLLNAKDDEWHIVDDKSKTIGDVKLEDNIQKGALILQISRDNSNWITVDTKTNLFADTPTQAGSFYDISDIQLINGSYYRVIVAYELSKKGESSKILFVNKDNYDYRKIAEVYNFYICNNDQKADSSLDGAEKTKLGKRERTEDEGYTGTKDIDKDDPHYGWDLGDFFVSGYTGKNTIDGTQYFLKNVGDEVTLGFYLNNDINGLNGDDNISIAQDKKGYDKYFEISPTDFGRGTLIISYTDSDGVTSKPQIYTNYLEANLSPAANTIVKLCEEGDYEVALDYKIQNDNKVVFGKSVFPEYSYYRIFFKFSVRNSNCMVYTFDSETGTELLNGNVTNNGFYIDLANSQYLDVSVKKEILEEGADGLTEDTRFNRKAKDKEAYSEDGIYTITVKNKAAYLESSKKIYVGDNRILRAYMVTGLSIPEIQAKIAEGATITEDGTIIEVTGKEVGEEQQEQVEDTQPLVEESGDTDEEPEQESDKTFSIDYGVIALVVVAAVAIFLFSKKRKQRPIETEIDDETNEEEKNE